MHGAGHDILLILCHYAIVQIRCFGSFATKLYLPVRYSVLLYSVKTQFAYLLSVRFSDIDMVVLGPEDAKAALNRLANELKRQRLTKHLEVISHARVSFPLMSGWYGSA